MDIYVAPEFNAHVISFEGDELRVSLDSLLRADINLIGRRNFLGLEPRRVTKRRNRYNDTRAQLEWYKLARQDASSPYVTRVGDLELIEDGLTFSLRHLHDYSAGKTDLLAPYLYLPEDSDRSLEDRVTADISVIESALPAFDFNARKESTKAYVATRKLTLAT